MNALSHFKNLHTDAVSWKAAEIWKTATNPDATVIATTSIVAMLTCISNVMKSCAYAARIPEIINEHCNSFCCI